MASFVVGQTYTVNGQTGKYNVDQSGNGFLVNDQGAILAMVPAGTVPQAGADTTAGGGTGATAQNPVTTNNFNLPWYPLTYGLNQGKYYGTYPSLQDQIMKALERQSTNDWSAAHFGRWDFGGGQPGGGGGTGGGGTGGGGTGGGGTGGGGATTYPRHEPQPFGASAGGGMGGAGTGIRQQSPPFGGGLLTPATGGLTRTTRGLLGGTPAAKSLLTPTAAPAATPAATAPRGPTTAATPTGQAPTPDSFQGMYPAAQSPATLASFRFSGSTPEEQNYNYLAGKYGTDVAANYLNAAGQALRPLLWNQLGGSDLAKALVNMGAAGGSAYAMGQAVPGAFAMNLTPAQVAQFGWSQVNPAQYASRYSVTLPAK